MKFDNILVGWFLRVGTDEDVLITLREQRHDKHYIVTYLYSSRHPFTGNIHGTEKSVLKSIRALLAGLARSHQPVELRAEEVPVTYNNMRVRSSDDVYETIL